MRKEGAIEFSFTWIFAIIVGIVILFIAIYASSNLLNLGRTGSDLKSSKEIGILLNPLETGFESASSNYFIMPVETRIYPGCRVDDFDKFGAQRIRISQMSFNKWSETNDNVEFQNKYIFSREYVEGEKFYVFSKPLELPFKISDLIYLSSENNVYCFIDSPDEIKRELDLLGQSNILTNCSEEQKKNSYKVCFSGNCDINVNLKSYYTEKEGERMYFRGESLMFASIFSDKEIYECQLKRLMGRTESLVELYIRKSNFVSSKNCDSNIQNELELFRGVLDGYESSDDINRVYVISQDIEDKNEDNKQCPLW